MRRFAVVLVVSCLIVGAVAPVASAVVGEPTDAAGDRPADGVVTAWDGIEGSDCSFPTTVTDGTGTEITLEEEPETVVTLNPSAAQTMWEIGAERKVVGLTKHAKNLDGAEERRNVSTPAETIEPEIVVDLEPDLVLAPGSSVVTDELVEQLRDLGLTVYYYPSAESIDEVRENTHRLGSLVGECAGAAETVEWMDRELEVVESAVENEQRPTVLYTFFGFTAGEGTFIDEMIETAGGDNVATDVGITDYEMIDEETVVDADPDWIVLNSNDPELPDGEGYNTITAVREDRVVVVDVNLLNRPAPRIVHGITELAETFHPEAYEQARAELDADGVGDGDTGGNASGGTEERDGEIEGEDGDEGSDGIDGADELSGFGVSLTAAAVLIATLVAIRRREGSR